MEKEEKAIYSRQVMEFVASANEYCKYLEGASQVKGIEILKFMQRLLPYLYIRASLMPAMEPVFDEGNEKCVTEDDYKRIYRTLLLKMGNADKFPVIVDIGDPADGLYTGSIAESLTDIYQDLKDFLINYRTGTEEVMNDAVWEVNLNFEEFWGEKLVNSLSAIHRFLYSGKELEEAEIEPEEDQPGGKDILL
ncbi:MAG TPA: DUF5063 domain-containing protein [Bacteroidales bacterium]|nr:DUF5063 domain-containing protein [Bacteroidales bacterium]HPT11054.1 DUF5063 domain-containing protein [Bacteroidales bacterium]